ncbi:hypothetical protein ACQEUU_13635 [Nonomuraea sp. CA-218870]|uniref:hypothetical protein n=1 Tax=Nonomuraea sp. CA-218870 TaxID=3239998 RepID=UPI003D9116BA
MIAVITAAAGVLLAGGPATAEDERCVKRHVGPGWSPNWPMLDELGIRRLVERSSGTASVCVGGRSATPERRPSTTAVEP